MSRSLLDEGFAVLAVDHVLTDPLAPVTLLDLTDVWHQEILRDILNHHPPDYIHLGMPCGTASRAREKPISHHQRQMGAPNPPPLRSATHPLGLPHINPATTAGIRLAKANQLYRFVIQILYLAMRQYATWVRDQPRKPASFLVLGSNFGYHTRNQ